MLDPRMPCTELYVRLGDEEVLVLDCRDPDDWVRYGLHIPGALWMPFEELLREAEVLPDDELIVVCGCAEDGSDARRACRLLQLRGRNAICLEGGLQAWITTGLPTESHEVGASVGMC
ncbi:rhodanese-like domain-containing protein [Archangium violaceum]|uniref:rhodanese-like domain-containing protein n=1 Tax=Archangium violaceum TaxID=83451 RepID=UPI0031B8A726